MLWLLQNTTVTKTHIVENESHNTAMLETILEGATVEKVDGHSVCAWEIIQCLVGAPVTDLIIGLRRAGRKQRFELHLFRRPLWGNPLLMAAAKQGLQGLSPSALHNCASVSGVDTLVLSVELYRWRRWRPEQASWASEIPSLHSRLLIAASLMQPPPAASSAGAATSSIQIEVDVPPANTADVKDFSTPHNAGNIATESVGVNTSPISSPRESEGKKQV